MASTSTSSRRGLRHSILLFMPVTVVYSREKPTHTSGLGVVSVSLAGILQRSDSMAVCGNGTGRARSAVLRGSWQAISHRTSWLRDVHHRGRSFTAIQSGCFQEGGVYNQQRVWASGTGQRVDDSRPLPSSFPCLSCGISQMLPRR